MTTRSTTWIGIPAKDRTVHNGLRSGYDAGRERAHG